jgi:hypothetical protein
MKCSFLKTEPVFCSVNNGVYAPSAYEREEYCMRNKHKLCPFYCSVRMDGKFSFTREMRLQGASFCRSRGR